MVAVHELGRHRRRAPKLLVRRQGHGLGPNRLVLGLRDPVRPAALGPRLALRHRRRPGPRHVRARRPHVPGPHLVHDPPHAPGLHRARDARHHWAHLGVPRPRHPDGDWQVPLRVLLLLSRGGARAQHLQHAHATRRNLLYGPRARRHRERSERRGCHEGPEVEAADGARDFGAARDCRHNEQKRLANVLEQRLHVQGADDLHHHPRGRVSAAVAPRRLPARQLGEEHRPLRRLGRLPPRQLGPH
mmetsp:Transcript_19565/g.67159  ORF Transcript_19565/g.67159 Transcript_19565/m.67159 type:complete len:245 (+) Transcript_19565:489-1223(+)